MKLFKNRFFAGMIAAVMIFLSIFALGGRSLKKEREKAVEIYFNGEFGDGMGIEYDLKQRVNLASNLISVGKRYFDKNDSLIKDVDEAILVLSKEDEDISSKAKANQELTTACDNLYSALLMENLSERDRRYNYSIKQDLDSHNIIISGCGYNEEAKKFNLKYGKFPADIIGNLNGIRLLPYFE